MDRICNRGRKEKSGGLVTGLVEINPENNNFIEGKMIKLKAHIVSRGRAEGDALVTSQPISFLGSIDMKTGVVIESGHELAGKSIKGKVLVFPGGKGSTVGSYAIYQLKKNGAAPLAMINIKAEPIVAVGAIISDIPLVDRVEKNPVTAIRTGDKVLVDAIVGSVEIL